MIRQLAIGPHGEAAAAFDAILARAAADPRCFHVADAADRHTLIFCGSPDEARQQEVHYAQEGRVAATCCELAMDRFGLRAGLEGSAAARGALQDLLRWIFATYAPCRVWDEDSGREITDFEQVFA